MAPRTSGEEHVIIEGYDVLIRRKKVKNLNLRVSPSGEITVSAPPVVRLSKIEEMIHDKKAWIEQVLRDIADSPQKSAENANPQELAEWKRTISELAPPLIAYWEGVIGVKSKIIAYRNMKSRWGSCTPSTGRICLNTRLALYPPICLEYVVVHELCHLRERGHGSKFKALMDEYLPDWRERRAMLR